MEELKETRAGLPNTCSKCGKEVGASWFAANDESALAGAGLCANCAGEKQTFEERAQPNKDVEALKRAVADVLTGGAPNERVLRPEGETEAPAGRGGANLPASDRQATDAASAPILESKRRK
jgi:hypothetical protein